MLYCCFTAALLLLYLQLDWLQMQVPAIRRVALIDLVGLDMLGDEGWVVLLGLLGILLAAPAAVVSSASSVPMYDASGWLQVWRVKVPLGAYFLLAFALSLRAAKHIKALRSQKYSLYSAFHIISTRGH